MTKRRFCFCIALTFIFFQFALFSYAEEWSLMSEREKAIDEAMHRLELGTEVSYIKYKEPSMMRESGTMYGITGSYTYHGRIPGIATSLDPLEDWVLTLEGRGSWGEVDYRNSGTIDDIDDYILEGRGLVGYAFSPWTWEYIAFIPYTGIGYRYLNDDMGGKVSSTGAKGYERESNYLYVPLGIESKVSLQNHWSLGARVEYDFLTWAEQKTHLSDVDPGYNDPKNRQKKGYGIRGLIKIVKRFNKLDLVIEPFYRYWSIRSSERADWTDDGTLIGYTWEPKNTSQEVGVKLGVAF